MAGYSYLGGGEAISWESKKQNFITISTMEFEFGVLVAGGKES